MNTLEYLLTKVSEECNETGQRASKAMCFGIGEIQEGQTLTNAERLIYEFNDLVAVMQILQEEGYVGHIFDEKAIADKKEKLVKWMKYSQDIGTLNTYLLQPLLDKYGSQSK